MNAPLLYTIGHSNHELSGLIDLVQRHQVAVIADVRSSPYSRFTPQFNRESLIAALRNQGMDYLFLGKELGARRIEQECYCDQKVKFNLVAQLPIFREGLARLRSVALVAPVALLCAEKDPLTCHRTILVCRHLRKENLAIRHILEDGSLERHEDAENRLLAMMKLPPGDLFQSKDELVEEAYDRQGDRIAFVDSGALPVEAMEHVL